MHGNPGADWQDLAEHYRCMFDEELQNLADDFGNLTPTAQEVLRTELSNRGLPAPGTKPVVFNRQESNVQQNWASEVDPEAGVRRSRPFDESEKDAEGAGPREFTWKTPLCDCESYEEAWQISEALKRAGIESWIERPGAMLPVVWDERMVGNLQIRVAADQLDEAREIAAKPVPQEIVDESREEVPDYEPPKCPSCGVEDPVLESAEPTNSWLCAACGKQWTEPQLAGEEQAAKPGKEPLKNGKSRPATGQLFPQGE